MASPIFHPTFGSRPQRIVGRDAEIAALCSGLGDPVGSRNRCNLILGQRGMGKTALLLELEERARDLDFVVARVTHNPDMLQEIIELIQIGGSKFVSKSRTPVAGFDVGALGFSFGLTFNEETRDNYGFRVKLSLLCDELGKHGKGVLVLVDEAQTSDDMRQLATTYQNLVGEGRNIAICMAGLPHAVSTILNDQVLTFLNRATKMPLGPIAIAEVASYYSAAFGELGIEADSGLTLEAAEDSRGFPYLMQLIGYYLARRAQSSGRADKDDLARSVAEAKTDLVESVFAPILAPLSVVDIEVLCAMAVDEGTSSVSDVIRRTGRTDSSFQPYRARLLDAGVIESPRRGELVFAVPFLAEYLREQSKS